jgi:hypothetical protein
VKDVVTERPIVAGKAKLPGTLTEAFFHVAVKWREEVAFIPKLIDLGPWNSLFGERIASDLTKH